MFGQPFAKWFIIPFQTEVSKQDTSDIQAAYDGPCFSQRINLLINPPGIEQIHEGIMNHIGWVGDVAQEFAYLRRTYVCGGT